MQILKREWQRITFANPGAFGQEVLEELFSIAPEVNAVFNWTNYSIAEILKEQRFIKHAAVFEDTFTIVINSLGKIPSDDLGAKLVTFGTQHSFITRFDNRNNNRKLFINKNTIIVNLIAQFYDLTKQEKF